MRTACEFRQVIYYGLPSGGLVWGAIISLIHAVYHANAVDYFGHIQLVLVHSAVENLRLNPAESWVRVAMPYGRVCSVAEQPLPRPLLHCG